MMAERGAAADAIYFHGTRGEHGYLANFWPAPITLGGCEWRGRDSRPDESRTH